MRLNLIPNLLTGCNLSAGLLAIYFSGKSRADISSLLVLTAIIFDGLDGWTARLLKQESVFGRLFDCAADFVSFGIAPSFIYFHLLQKKDVLILSAIFIYICASAIRLIKFNNLGKNKLLNNFIGLPTTASAGLLILLIALFSKDLRRPIFFISVFIILSVLMLSHIPFRKFNK